MRSAQFAGAGRADLEVLDAQHFGRALFVDAYDLAHGNLPRHGSILGGAYSVSNPSAMLRGCP